MALHVIRPAPDEAGADRRLLDVLNYALEGREVQLHCRAEELDGLNGERLLFALPLGEAGHQPGGGAHAGAAAPGTRTAGGMYRRTGGGWSLPPLYQVGCR